jgi:hypothetical protein
MKEKLDQAQKQRETFQQELEEAEVRQMAQEELKSDEVYGHNEERVVDSFHKEYSPYSDLSLPIDRVPEEITRRMTKVFSKHHIPEMRDWGKLLMRNYQALHATEKPMNLEYVKPYANTSDLVNKTPYIHANQAKKSQEEEEKQKQSANSDDKQQTSTVEMEQEEGTEAFTAKSPNKKSHSERKEESER